MFYQNKTDNHNYIRLFKKNDLERPVHTTRDCPSFEERGFYDKLPRAIVRDGIVYGDTKTVDEEGFRVYIEDDFVWHAKGALDN